MKIEENPFTFHDLVSGAHTESFGASALPFRFREKKNLSESISTDIAEDWRQCAEEIYKMD